MFLPQACSAARNHILSGLHDLIDSVFRTKGVYNAYSTRGKSVVPVSLQERVIDGRHIDHVSVVSSRMQGHHISDKSLFFFI
jgi:hypothetical protein